MSRRVRVIFLAAALALLPLGYSAWAGDSDKPLAADPNEDLKLPANPRPSSRPAGEEAATSAESAEPAADTAASTAGGAAASQPGTLVPKKLTPEQRKDRLFKFLEGEFARLYKTPDWIKRALISISYSKIPTKSATKTLLSIIKNDSSEIVRLVGWEAMLSRRYLHSEFFDEWVAITMAMAEKGVFRGSLRVGLFRMLATVPPTDKTKSLFMKAFAETNSLDSEDISTLDAMGQCLAAWQSTSIVDQLIGKFSNLDEAFRAEYILQKAGAKAPAAITHVQAGSEQMWKIAQGEYTTWWGSTKATWKEPTKSEIEKWRAIEPQLVEPPEDPQSINVEDPKWKKELELGGLGLRSFDIVLAVDVTGSMGEVILWLKRDVKKMMQAFALVSREPRIGITFYRDSGNLARDEFVTKSVPLTDKGDTLVQALSEMKAKGGGDIPEAVLEALTEAYSKNPWSGGKESRKIVLLIGDAPNHPETQDKCDALVKEKAEKGFKLYAVKVTTEFGANDLSSFDNMCKLGDGEAISVDFPASKGMRGLGELPPKKKGGHDLSPQELAAVACALTSEDPGTKVLREILTGLINPQYKDRLGPFAATVIAYCEDFIPEKRRPWPPYTPPPTPERGPGPREPRKPGPPPKPYDPQQ